MSYGSPSVLWAPKELEDIHEVGTFNEVVINNTGWQSGGGGMREAINSRQETLGKLPSTPKCHSHALNQLEKNQSKQTCLNNKFLSVN